MAVSPQFKAYLAELLEPLGPVAFKRLFGGVGISLGGVTFAFIMGQSLYLRVDDETRPLFEDAGMEPFSYATKKRHVMVRSFYAIPEGLYDDADEFHDWARAALAAAQNAARAKARKKAHKKAPVTGNG